MIDFLQRIWQDVSKGENLDAYLTIMAALVISLLNILGIAPATIIPGITLGVIALLAIASLIDRHKIEDLNDKISPSFERIFVDEFDNGFKSDFAAAREIWLYGASLDGVANDFYSMFEHKLRQGFKIRILTIDPSDTRVLEISEMRAYMNPSVTRAQAKINATISDFCELRKISPGNLQIRILKFPITHRLIALNPDETTGKMYISNYPFKTPGGSLPKFVLSGRDGKWYELFLQEAKYMWNTATDWNCP